MPKVIFLADVHLGYPNKLSDIILSLETIRQYGIDNGIDTFVILGDLFHTRQAIATDVMAEAHNFFIKNSEYEQNWCAFPGNHDMFLKHSWKINSLRVLTPHLDVMDKESAFIYGEKRFWILPYIHDELIYMKALEKIGDKSDDSDILLTHVGANGATLNECFLHKNWSVVQFDDFPLKVFSGHFHCHQQVGDNLWYPGSPIPFRYDEGLVDHGFIVYDTDADEHEFVKIYDLFGDIKPPDFPTIPDLDIDELEEDEVRGNNVRVALGREYTKDELVEIRSKLVDMGANSVSWKKAKEKDVHLGEEMDDTEISMADPNRLIKLWFDGDKPEAISEKLLLKLNEDVVSIGNEQAIEDD